MISKTSIEAVDGCSSEKAGSSLLALTAQGGTTLRGAAEDFFPTELSMSSTYCQHNHLTFSARAACACGQHFLPGKSRQLWEMRRQQRSPWHDKEPGSCLCPYYMCRCGNLGCDFPSNTSRDSMPQAGFRLSPVLSLVGSDSNHGPLSMQTHMYMWAVPSSAFPASTLMETGETCPSLGTQPGHALCKSSWPPLKVKGTRPRTPARNRRCRKAAGAAQLCHSFCQQ